LYFKLDMQKRAAIYIRSVGTSEELYVRLRQAAEHRGVVVIATYVDDARIEGRGKNAAWNRLLSRLDLIDQIVLADAGDLPGKSVKDLLKTLATLTAKGVNLYVPSLGIDTASGSAAVLDLVEAFRRSRLSQAFRRGQARARAGGKRIGRPPIPASVKRRILADLADGAGVRPTARRYGVSPASVVSLKQSMAVTDDRLAA